MSMPSVDWWPSGAWGVFWLFMVPIGPGKAAGILLGKNAGLDFLALLGLYLAKDLVTALYLDPLLRALPRLSARYEWARSLGKQIGALATRTHLGSGRLAQMFSLVLVSVGAGFITGGAALSSARLPRPLGWLALLTGDLLWFSCLLAAALGLTSIVPDDRMVFVAVVLLALLARPLTRRLTSPPLQPAPPTPD